MEPHPVYARPVTNSDLTIVSEIFADYVTNSVVTFELEPPSVRAWRHKRVELASRALPFLVAEGGGHVLGYAYASPWRDKPAYWHTVEDTIYVRPESTRNGIGRILLTALLERCRTTRVRQMLAVIADTGSPRRRRCIAEAVSPKWGGCSR